MLLPFAVGILPVTRVSAAESNAVLCMARKVENVSGVCGTIEGENPSGGQLNVEEDLTMPSYSYVCRSCRKSFTVQMTIAEHDKGRVKCPKCKGRNVAQQFGSFGVKTSKKS